VSLAARSGHPTTTTNFTHDQLNRDAAIATAGGYDANGNLTSDGVRTFSYDVENRLIGVTGGAAPLTIAYDPLGRIAKTTSGAAGTDFLYDGARLIAEYNSANGALLRSYVHGTGTDDPLLWLEGGPSAYNVDNVGNDPRWLYRDRQGSVIGTAGPNGLITPYTYGPFGEPQSWAGSRFRYTGQIALPEAQLYHYKARAYDPVMGRFLQTDPIGYGDGMNIYAYTHGDPVNGLDLEGLAGADATDLSEVVVTALSRGFDAVTFSGLANMKLNLGNAGLGSLANLPNLTLGDIGKSISESIDKAVEAEIKKLDPAGTHRYQLKMALCTACTLDDAMNAARSFAAPGQQSPAKDGVTAHIILAGNNPITQTVDPKTHTIVNQTEPDHVFYPGTVTITFSRENGVVTETVTGTGNGDIPKINILAGMMIFQGMMMDTYGILNPNTGVGL